MRFRPLLLLAVFFALLVPAFALAGSNDKEVTELVTGIMGGDYKSGNYDAALEQLALAKQACEGNTCSAKVRGKVFVALGTVLAGKKKTAEAKSAFILALKEDPNAALFPEYSSPDAQSAWSDAKKEGSGATSGTGGAAAVTTGSAGAAGATSGAAVTKPPDTTLKPRKQYPGDVRPGRGWKTGEGYFYYQEAVASEGSRDWADCAANAKASLEAESRVTTRYLAASCEERAGLWIEAQGDYQIVADTGASTGLREVARQARAKAEELAQKVPKLIIRKPAKVTNLVVKLNNVELPPEKLGGELWLNPGQRTIFAKGKLDGVDGEFEQVVEAQEFETVSVEIKLLPPGSRVRDATVLKCMSEAKSADDFARCVGARSATSKASINYGMGLEFSAYHDSDHTDVVTPAILAKLESPTGGWGANASLLIDVVTTASADIVARASPRWTEVRYVPAAGAHKKFGDIDVSLGAGASIEPDYLSAGGSIGAAVDLRQKTVTPAIAYGFGYDISARSATPWSVYSHPISRHSLDASITFVVDKATFFTPSLTLVFENGDSSKPYRYVPMFSPDIAPSIGQAPGLTSDAVNLYRNTAVLEQLPLSRQRYAIAARIAHRFASSTLRAEERLYIDSWGGKDTTTDAQFLIDFSKSFRAWPHLRFHVQDGVDFWKLAYTADPIKLQYPRYRTGDRELGPLLGATAGLGARLGLGKDQTWALTATFDFVYTRFFETLYILQRFGYFGATTLEVDFD